MTNEKVLSGVVPAVQLHRLESQRNSNSCWRSQGYIRNGVDLADQFTIQRQAADQVLHAMEANVMPWSRASKLSINALDQNPYDGMNLWLLEISAIAHGFKSCLWATFDQWESIGGIVSDSDGTTILCQRPWVEDLVEYFTVMLYNQEQVDNIDIQEPEHVPNYDIAKRIVEFSGAEIRPYVRGMYVQYRCGSDWIGMPSESDYSRSGDYWSTMFHELIHWASYGVDRLAWKGDLATGELIAELGETILLDRCGLVNVPGALEEVRDDHLYWMRDIRRRVDHFEKVAEVASQAARYLLCKQEGIEMN